MVEISVLLFGDEQLSFKLNNIGNRASHLQPAMEWARDEIIDIVEQQFETEGARSGHKWQKLAFATIKARGSAHPILIHFGDLFDELISPARYFVSDDSIEYHGGWASDEYGHFHQTGTGKMPARPPFEFTDHDEQHLTHGVNRFIFGEPL